LQDLNILSRKKSGNVQTVSRRNLSPAENKAISNLNAIVKIAPTEQKRMALLRALDIIKNGILHLKDYQNPSTIISLQMQNCSKSRINLLNSYLLPFSTGTTFPAVQKNSLNLTKHIKEL